MSKITLTDLENLQNETTAVNDINNNNADLEIALENTLSRDGTLPNQMEASLDMNSNRTLNLPAAIAGTDPVRKAEIDTLLLTGNLPDFLLPMDLVNGGTGADLGTTGGPGSVLQQVTVGAPITSETIYDLSPTVNGLATNLPNISIAQNQQLIRTSGYTELGLGAATYKRVTSQPSHPGKLRSKDRYLPNGTISNSNGGWWEIRETTLDVSMFGASTSITDAQNKTILQEAITTCDALGGGVVTISWPIDYGFVRTNMSTYPNFTGVVNDMVVIDRGNGSTHDLEPPPAKEGFQERVFYHTVPNAPGATGAHDGNFTSIAADWHPGLRLANLAVYAAQGDPSRQASDNLRTSLLYAHGGREIWQLGIGQAQTGDVPVDAMYHYVITGLNPDFTSRHTPLFINYLTGAVSVSAGSAGTQASFLVKREPLVHGFDSTLPTVLIENQFANADLTLRNSIGFPVDVTVTNDSGAWSFQQPTVSHAGGSRPTGMPIGAQMFDTSLGIPIWHQGAGVWSNAAGSVV